MNDPGVVLLRFLRCLAEGVALGLGVETARPLLRRFWLTGQLLISGMLVFCWLRCCFGICRGDLRPGYLTGIALGLNLFNALFIGVLGVPGLILLLLSQWVLA